MPKMGGANEAYGMSSKSIKNNELVSNLKESQN